MFSLLVVLTLVASLNRGILGARVELHYESLCKQCQIHVAGFTDDVIHGGLELSPESAGVLSELELSIDYYGVITQNTTCEKAASAANTEHGPDMCATDRVHLCAQSLYGGSAPGAAAAWWPFVHCMFMMIDGLKCGQNGHCANESDFQAAYAAVVPTCAALTSVDAAAVQARADGPDGVALAAASYQATARTASDGFAPAYVNGVYVDDADAFWRDSPDQLLYGRTLLETICESFDAGTASQAAACANVTSMH